MQRNPKVDWQAVADVLYGCANHAGEYLALEKLVQHPERGGAHPPGDGRLAAQGG